MSQFVVVTFYKFVPLKEVHRLRNSILDFGMSVGIKGTIILAEEGINATIAGTRGAVDEMLTFLRADVRFADLEHKKSFYKDKPFHRFKVKVKKEIVTLGHPDIDPTLKVGHYVDARIWNQLLEDPDVLVIDTRNQYEVDVGTFKNAVSPHTATFREFPAFVKTKLDRKKHRKVAMFCTGGIRCEKATSYLLQEGFEEVYHLDGGILKYLEEIGVDENLWKGECFVFDGRVAVNRELKKGNHTLCYACRLPLSPEDRQSPLYEEGVSCPHCLDKLTEGRKRRLRERHRQVKLAKARRDIHIGQTLNKKAS